jgi:hypothetical protein
MAWLVMSLAAKLVRVTLPSVFISRRRILEVLLGNETKPAKNLSYFGMAQAKAYLPKSLRLWSGACGAG